MCRALSRCWSSQTPRSTLPPDLEAKVDITQNAIDVALALGIDKPKVGVLSAVETVTPKIPSTLDAAILAMADRGQIRGAVVDGPLAMDMPSIWEQQGRRGLPLWSRVMPRPDRAKSRGRQHACQGTRFRGKAEAAGLILGCSIPTILTSRADGEKARLASLRDYRAWRADGTATIHLERAAE